MQGCILQMNIPAAAAGVSTGILQIGPLPPPPVIPLPAAVLRRLRVVGKPVEVVGGGGGSGGAVAEGGGGVVVGEAPAAIILLLLSASVGIPGDFRKERTWDNGQAHRKRYRSQGMYKGTRLTTVTIPSLLHTSTYITYYMQAYFPDR